LVTIYLVALLILPGAYTAADATEPTEGTSTEATPAPTPEPAPTPTEETPTPESSPSPEPTESPAPAPDPTETITEPSPSPTTAVPHEVSLAEDLTLALAAAPIELMPGDATTITARIENPSDAKAEKIDVTLLLPNGLTFVSANPSADDVSARLGGTAVVFNSLDVDAGGSIAPTIHAAVEPDAKKSLTVSGEVVWTGGQASDQAALEIGTPGSTIKLTTSGGGFLKQVGGQIDYDISVKNTGDEVANDVTLINLVPSEVHVTGAGLAPGVDAVQVGNSGGKEDVVWVIDELPAGETIKVNYTGTIESPGDLEAFSKTRVVSTNAGRASSEERTYLADAGGEGSDNPTYEEREKRITRHKVVRTPLVRKRVATEPDAPGSSGSGELPFTGVDPLGTVLLGMALIALGMVVVHATSVNTDRRRIAVGSLALVLVAGACMSNGGDEVEPRVLGTQLTRSPDPAPAEDDGPTEADTDTGPVDGDDDPSDPADSDDDTDEGDDNGPTGDGSDGQDDADEGIGDDSSGDGSETTTVLVPGDPITTFEEDVDFVTITGDDLPVRALGSAEGSTMTFGWNDSSSSITQVISSNSLVEGIADLSAQISPAGPGMKLTVSITNAAEATVLGLDGTLALELDAGGTHTLKSEPVDVELNPGGASSASFSFRLPSGSYSARAVFLSS
jgi:uncharacterized repeat protein (TIGR01451 family)